ncbi:MAG: GGDEF-domain containing protein [Desulfobulbus propionicus]|nr:MAG: GGDEF-domain containing protein [Desulfobulbus propionicus]
MTLYRQLLLYSLLLLLTLFTVLWFARLETTRTFLNDQLSVHAQDTATSLGLSLSAHLHTMDIPAMETMINALFDRGYYRSICLLDLENTAMVERSLDVKVEEVPEWFISLVPLNTVLAEAQVMDRWQRAGTVQVQCHPGYAYRTLWQTTRNTSLLFLATALCIILVGGGVLSLLLRPLRRVEQQALALSNRQYQLQKQIPRTRELRRVVLAMNHLTSKVREIFDSQSKTADNLRRRVYQDSLTGLGNRRFLEARVNSSLAAHRSGDRGAFLLIHLHGLQDMNLQQGYQSGDALLVEAAALLNETAREHDHALLARLTGGYFALYLPGVSTDDAQGIGQTIMKQLSSRLKGEELTLAFAFCSIGGVTFERQVTLAELLSQADNALRQAQSGGANTVVIVEAHPKEAMDRTHCLQILQQAMDRQEISLFTQPVVTPHDTEHIIHLEVLARIILEGQVFPAGMFMPLAKMTGTLHRLDKIIVTAILSHVKEQGPIHRLAINLAPHSLNKPGFGDWLLAQLKILADMHQGINIEFAETPALKEMAKITAVTRQVQQLGHRVGIDHFGRGLINYGYLKSLRPDYIKVDRTFTDELKEDNTDDAAFFLSSLCSAVHSLDIAVIVEGIETEQQLERLRTINLDAMQGFFIEEPSPLVTRGL